MVWHQFLDRKAPLCRPPTPSALGYVSGKAEAAPTQAGQWTRASSSSVVEVCAGRRGDSPLP